MCSVIAACWGFVDHDRGHPDYKRRVGGPLAGYGILLALGWGLCPAGLESAFAAGLETAIVIHLLNFVLPVLGLYGRRRDEEKTYREFLSRHRDRSGHA